MLTNPLIKGLLPGVRHSASLKQASPHVAALDSQHQLIDQLVDSQQMGESTGDFVAFSGFPSEGSS